MLISEREQLRENIEEWVEQYGANRSSLIPVMEEVQREYGHISEYVMQVVADILDIHPVEVDSVVSFYSFLGHKSKGRFIVRLCRTISCEMQDKARVAQQLENDLGICFGETTANGHFTLEWANCLGMCDQGPALLVNDRIYTHVTPESVHDILEECRSTFGVYGPNAQTVVDVKDADTSKMTFSGVAGRQGLEHALKMEPKAIIAAIDDSGLKGRGGAGFPTSLKWKLAAEVDDEVKYVVCNADEGEPGTFKDRVILTNFPDLMFEGMTIAGRATGAGKGIVYLRGEYTYLRASLEDKLAKRRKDGSLGSNVFGVEGFDFDIEIRMGAGAYVCGEETALIESLEGHRGEPRNRPPFPVNTGLMGHPTIVNNVETFAWVPCILVKGTEWFRMIGTETSTGLKLFSVSGDCREQGVFEFPLGISIRELLEKVGGEDAKAVQVGGAAGHCIPASEFDRAIAFEDLATGGSIIVFGPERDMLEVAKNFMEFFLDESCGQCTPCREGNMRLFEGIEMLEKGECSMKYLRELCLLGETMQMASKCGLGQSSPNAFLSIVENFKDEIMGRVSAAC
ncbi:MAG: NAD(P)H-dependent oxidoreductase subunit E [Verrucomicrobiota bacterium]